MKAKQGKLFTGFNSQRNDQLNTLIFCKTDDLY